MVKLEGTDEQMHMWFINSLDVLKSTNDTIVNTISYSVDEFDNYKTVFDRFNKNIKVFVSTLQQDHQFMSHFIFCIKQGKRKCIQCVDENTGTYVTVQYEGIVEVIIQRISTMLIFEILSDNEEEIKAMLQDRGE